MATRVASWSLLGILMGGQLSAGCLSSTDPEPIPVVVYAENLGSAPQRLNVTLHPDAGGDLHAFFAIHLPGNTTLAPVGRALVPREEMLRVEFRDPTHHARRVLATGDFVEVVYRLGADGTVTLQYGACGEGYMTCMPMPAFNGTGGG
jgi:hypothetical protein